MVYPIYQLPYNWLLSWSTRSWSCVGDSFNRAMRRRKRGATDGMKRVCALSKQCEHYEVHIETDWFFSKFLKKGLNRIIWRASTLICPGTGTLLTLDVRTRILKIFNELFRFQTDTMLGFKLAFKILVRLSGHEQFKYQIKRILWSNSEVSLKILWSTFEVPLK